MTSSENLALPKLRKIPSVNSISDHISPSAITPSTPSLTPGASAATDDEETDFQSAYSTSPRGSYGSSFEKYGVKSYETDEQSEQGTPTTVVGEHHLDEFGTHRDFASKSQGRERNFSTSTATNARVRSLTTRTSNDTVGGRA